MVENEEKLKLELVEKLGLDFCNSPLFNLDWILLDFRYIQLRSLCIVIDKYIHLTLGAKIHH